MNEYIVLILTILDNNQLVKVAIKLKSNQLHDKYYMEDNNLSKLTSLLPSDIAAIGPIVDIEPIHEMVMNLKVVGP